MKHYFILFNIWADNISKDYVLSRKHSKEKNLKRVKHCLEKNVLFFHISLCRFLAENTLI